jgi:hypothetical protein
MVTVKAAIVDLARLPPDPHHTLLGPDLIGRSDAGAAMRAALKLPMQVGIPAKLDDPASAARILAIQPFAGLPKPPK